MNYKLVLKTYSALRQLTDDETALLETLRSMTDAERELLAETLGPPAKVKASKAVTKKFKKCDVCGVSKRAAHHRDADHPDYHVFDEGAPKTTEKKSARASSLAEKIAGTAAKSLDGGVSKMRCVVDSCGEYADNPVHDSLMGYAGYHEFDSGQEAVAATGD